MEKKNWRLQFRPKFSNWIYETRKGRNYRDINRIASINQERKWKDCRICKENGKDSSTPYECDICK